MLTSIFRLDILLTERLSSANHLTNQGAGLGRRTHPFRFLIHYQGVRR